MTRPSVAVPLPPLRRKLLYAFLSLVFLYGLMGVLFVAAVFFAGGKTARSVYLHYEGVTHLQRLQVIAARIYGLRVESQGNGAFASQKKMDLARNIKRFDRVLANLKTHLMSVEEQVQLQKLEKEWGEWMRTPLSHPRALDKVYEKLPHRFRYLKSLHDGTILAVVRETEQFRYKILVGVVLIFLATFVFAVLLADDFAFRLANPLKEIAESLRNRPTPGEKLRLPTPTSLELRILTHEMKQLWKQLSELMALNLKEIASQRNKLEVVLQTVDDAILVLDNQGYIVQCNDGFAKLIGMSASKIPGQLWRDLPTGNSNYLTLRKALSSEIGPDSTLDLIDPSGQVEVSEISEGGGVHEGIKNGFSPLTFSIRSQEIKNKSNEVETTVYLLHDITQEKHRHKMRAEAIGVLLHELKIPLESLKVAAERLKGCEKNSGPDFELCIGTIVEDVDQLQGIASHFAEVEEGGETSLKFRAEVSPLSELLSEWVLPFRMLAEKRGVRLTYKPPEEGPLLANIDSVKFPWAISNLLSSAIRFAPDDSEILVEIRKISDGPEEGRGQIQIDIGDGGGGGPEIIAPTIFKQSGSAVGVAKEISQKEMVLEGSHRQRTGSLPPPSHYLGLGLIIVKEIVEAHGGTIRYLQREKGSVFQILLPAV